MIKSNREELLQRGQFLINRGISLIKFQKMWPGNLKEGQKLLKTGYELLHGAKEMKVGPLENKACLIFKIIKISKLQLAW